MEKLPPLEKIPEALSALADGRAVLIPEENRAMIRSSDGKKQYTVTWEDEVYASDDNATYWAGYPGYPVIAVWMRQGFLPYEETLAKQFAGVPWNELNAKHKRKYDRALQEVMETRGMDEQKTLESLKRIHEQIAGLPFSVKRGRKGTKK